MNSILIIAVYVDDLVLAGKCTKKIVEAKQSLSARFKMQDLGQLHHFLGIKVVQDMMEGKVGFGQPTYTLKLLNKFGMKDSKPVSTASDSDSKLVGKTIEEEVMDQKLYQAAVNQDKARHCIRSGKRGAVLFQPNSGTLVGSQAYIMRYLKGTHDLGLMYHRENTALSCVGYSDADWGTTENPRLDMCSVGVELQ